MININIRISVTRTLWLFFSILTIGNNGYAANNLKKQTNQGGQCIAFYIVPDNYTNRFDVDACWGGPHITLAGFAYYPKNSPAGSLSFQDALNLASKAPSKACKGSPWQVSDRDAKLKGKHQNKRTPKNRYLEFGTKEHPSNSLNKLAMFLEQRGVKKIWPNTHLGPHVTFDQCGCYSKCPNNTRNNWKKRGIQWRLIPVTSSQCNFPKAVSHCYSINNKYSGGKKTHGQCKNPNNVTWHYHLGDTVKSCSK